MRDTLCGQQSDDELEAEREDFAAQHEMWLEHAKETRNPNPMVRRYGPGPDGKLCGSCTHLFVERAKRYHKCVLRGITSGAGTDHRVRWLACAKFKETASG